MTGVWLLALLSEVNWSLCNNADASAWLQIESCLPLQPAVTDHKCGVNLWAVTDHKCGVNLRAISTFCTGLLIIFLNSEVTGLARLTSFLLLWKSFQTVPG